MSLDLSISSFKAKLDPLAFKPRWLNPYPLDLVSQQPEELPYNPLQFISVAGFVGRPAEKRHI